MKTSLDFPTLSPSCSLLSTSLRPSPKKQKQQKHPACSDCGCFNLQEGVLQQGNRGAGSDGHAGLGSASGCAAQGLPKVVAVFMSTPCHLRACHRAVGPLTPQSVPFLPTWPPHHRAAETRPPPTVPPHHGQRSSWGSIHIMHKQEADGCAPSPHLLSSTLFTRSAGDWWRKQRQVGDGVRLGRARRLVAAAQHALQVLEQQVRPSCCELSVGGDGGASDWRRTLGPLGKICIPRRHPGRRPVAAAQLALKCLSRRRPLHSLSPSVWASSPSVEAEPKAKYGAEGGGGGGGGGFIPVLLQRHPGRLRGRAAEHAPAAVRVASASARNSKFRFVSCWR